MRNWIISTIIIGSICSSCNGTLVVAVIVAMVVVVVVVVVVIVVAVAVAVMQAKKI